MFIFKFCLFFIFLDMEREINKFIYNSLNENVLLNMDKMDFFGNSGKFGLNFFEKFIK